MKRLKIFAALLICLSLASTPILADDLANFQGLVTKASDTFKDMTATLAVVQSNRRELEKMGKVFAETYQFKTAAVRFKSPDKLKMNGELGVMKAEFITAGNTRLVRIPSMRFKKKEDIAEQPEKKMTTLDIGVVSESVWSLYKVSLVRMEKNETGGPIYVIRLQTPTSKKSQLIWVDGTDLKLLKRERLLDDGSLKVRTVYSDHKLINGVLIPARAEVYNGDGKLAAVTETRDIKINTGIEDKEFE